MRMETKMEWRENVREEQKFPLGILLVVNITASRFKGVSRHPKRKRRVNSDVSTLGSTRYQQIRRYTESQTVSSERIM